MHTAMSHGKACIVDGMDKAAGRSAGAPEVGLQRDVSVVDHGTETVDVGAG